MKQESISTLFTLLTIMIASVAQAHGVEVNSLFFDSPRRTVTEYTYYSANSYEYKNAVPSYNYVTEYSSINTHTYSEQIVVTINGKSSAPQTAAVTVQDNGDGTINFVLNNFLLSNGENYIPIGNIAVENLAVTQGVDGLGHISFDGRITIQPGDMTGVSFWAGPSLGETPMKLQGKLNESKLYVTIDIDMQSSLGQVVYVQLGTDDFDAQDTNYNEQLVVIIDGKSSTPQFIGVNVVDNGNETVNIKLKNILIPLGENIMPFGNIEIENIPLAQFNAETDFISYDGNIRIRPGDITGINEWLGPAMGEVPIKIQGEINNRNFFAFIDINSQDSDGSAIQLLIGKADYHIYTLTYIVDGVIHQQRSFKCGEPISVEQVPTKEGYTFSGWSQIPALMPAKDIIATGTFMANDYTVTYMVDGEKYKTTTVTYGSLITPEMPPTKEGYTFSGWNKIPDTMPAGDIVITGFFSINQYNITFIIDDNEISHVSQDYGSPISVPKVPVKEGYTFSGWGNVASTVPAHDVTYVGSYKVNSYRLTYMVDGIEYKTLTIKYGETIQNEAEPIKEGYTFSGWNEVYTTMPAKDVLVTGVFIVNSYTLTYLVDGIEYKTINVAYGTPITPEASPEKTGFTFRGWSEIPVTMPSRNVVITGSFTINDYILTYIVNGEVYKETSVAYGTPIIPEAKPAMEGYTFKGWSEIPATMPDKDVVITGTFTINNYVLSYIVDGEEYKTLTIPYRMTIVPEKEPTKTGYTFSGWSEIPETMPANDVWVMGSFTIKLIQKIELEKNKLTFNSTESQRLSVTITPDDVLNKDVIWSSTNPDVATVDKDGVIKPINNGETFIIATTTDGTNLKDFCNVSVDFKASSVNLDRKIISISSLQKTKLMASVTPEKASQNIKWVSSNPSVVSVDNTGTIRPLKNGTAVITASTTDGTELKETCMVTVNIPNLFEAITTQTTLAIHCKDGDTTAKNLQVSVNGIVYNLNSENKIKSLAPNRKYHIKVTADLGEYNWTEEFDVSTADIEVAFDSKVSPTTVDIYVRYDVGDANLVSAGFEGGENMNSLHLTGLEPSKKYEYIYNVTTEEGGIATYRIPCTTDDLDIKISQTKVVALGDAVIVATSNITEEENLHIGFEWRRYDWPDEIVSKSGVGYIYEGTIEGSIKNANADKFWKIRPYYQSKQGNRYYGDWVTIDPSDVSYYAPSVHTYNIVNVEDNTAELKGFVMEGTEKISSQGFMYWKAPSHLSLETKKRRILSIPVNAKIIEATGDIMRVTLMDLDYETEYCYVAFVTTSENKTFYGEEKTFKTESASQDVIDGIETISNITEVARYDLNGRKISSPQKGINIIRMSDGTVKKVMIK